MSPEHVKVNKPLEVGRSASSSYQLFSIPTPVLVSPLEAAAEVPGHCDNIYQGFAKCLIRLGDGMGHGGELETICR